MAVNGERYFRVLMKNPDRDPIQPDDRGFARKALIQLAQAEGYKLTGEMTLLSSGYSEEDRLHVAAYGSFAARDTAAVARASSHLIRGDLGGPHERVTVLALRAHRTPLHSTQVVTSAVERTLTYREPLAARVALHLLHIPATSNKQAEHTHETLKAVFGSPA